MPGARKRRYRVELLPGALRDLRALPQEVKQRIRARIDSLVDDPYPRSAKRLKGKEGTYLRLRVGDYRIIYAVEKSIVVVVVRVGHRRDVYR